MSYICFRLIARVFGLPSEPRLQEGEPRRNISKTYTFMTFLCRLLNCSEQVRANYVKLYDTTNFSRCALNRFCRSKVTKSKRQEPGFVQYLTLSSIGLS